jgi:hypothetical protein
MENPRKQNKAAWEQRVEAVERFVWTRPGKLVGEISVEVGRARKKQRRTFWLVVRVTECTITKKDSTCWCPKSNSPPDGTT